MTDFVGLDAKIFGCPCLMSCDIYMNLDNAPRYVYVYELIRDPDTPYEFTTLRDCHLNPHDRDCAALIFATRPFFCDDVIIDEDPKRQAVVNESLVLTGTSSLFSHFLKREQKRKSRRRI